MPFSSVRMRRTERLNECAEDETREGGASHDAITSALVSRMVETGEPSLEFVTDKSGVARICWRRSGEAFRRNQCDESEETAT